MKKIRLPGLLFLAQATTAFAAEVPPAKDDKGFWYAQTSVYTRHFSPDPDHNNKQNLIGLERNEASGFVYGGATFRNSFGQRSYYAYAGQRYDMADYPVYLKITGGAIQGYRGKYRDKIPLNRLGVAPVVIPSVGTYYGPVAAEVVLLGFNAVMLTTGVRF
ncbi:sn-glycerol-3-phosphate transporter [Pseudomonas trivialis]|uniref:sn-glycerol-3-phosphate transporter n=1 Tax=Pseudomonas trivialis TaxID=200450 RepID=UPI0030D05C32